MKIEEIRNMTTDEINAKINETKEELFTLRFKLATGNLEKTSDIKKLRKAIARMKTILSEKMAD